MTLDQSGFPDLVVLVANACLQGGGAVSLMAGIASKWPSARWPRPLLLGLWVGRTCVRMVPGGINPFPTILEVTGKSLFSLGAGPSCP